LSDNKFGLSLQIEDPTGYVCIDDQRFPLSVGGIRLISGVTKEEVQDLSNAMVKKLHSYELPLSGAKAGVNSDNIEDLYRFVAHQEVKELIRGTKTHQFITGPDIGTSEAEYHNALRKADLSELIRPGLLSNLSQEYGMPLDNIVTAFGAVVAAEEVMRKEKESDPLDNIDIVIEGFGKVGTGLAKLLDGRANIVGLSTRYGCISDPKGFDINWILELTGRYGDNFVNHSGYQVQPVKDLFSIPCDLLIPGARTRVITRQIAEKIIKCEPQAIVPVSNAPYTDEALMILHSHGIICFPDFIASAGALLAVMVEFAAVGGEKEALELVRAAVTFETRDLLLEAIVCSDRTKSIYQIAEERAMQRKIVLLEQISSQDEDFSIERVALDVINRYAPHLLNKGK
jgi:glutamate dehydrogenase/leucine dehydrogenase